MRGRSVALRLDRLTDRRHVGDRERLVQQVAAETGLRIAEVRAELTAIEEHARRFGPSTIEQTVQQLADELGLPEAEVWAEVAVAAGSSGGGR